MHRYLIDSCMACINCFVFHHLEVSYPPSNPVQVENVASDLHCAASSELGTKASLKSRLQALTGIKLRLNAASACISGMVHL